MMMGVKAEELHRYTGNVFIVYDCVGASSVVAPVDPMRPDDVTKRVGGAPRRRLNGVNGVTCSPSGGLGYHKSMTDWQA